MIELSWHAIYEIQSFRCDHALRCADKWGKSSFPT